MSRSIGRVLALSPCLPSHQCGEIYLCKTQVLLEIIHKKGDIMVSLFERTAPRPACFLFASAKREFPYSKDHPNQDSIDKSATASLLFNFDPLPSSLICYLRPPESQDPLLSLRSSTTLQYNPTQPPRFHNQTHHLMSDPNFPAAKKRSGIYLQHNVTHKLHIPAAVEPTTPV